jgi:hypothetical protein
VVVAVVEKGQICTQQVLLVPVNRHFKSATAVALKKNNIKNGQLLSNKTLENLQLSNKKL